MKIEARFNFKAPETVENVERFIIKHGRMVIEISAAGPNGLHLRLDGPIGDQLAVFPHGSNTINMQTTREDEIR